MSAYISDDEQLQKLKDWWKKYGNSVMIIIIAVIALSFGLRYWQKYKIHSAQQASIIYEQMLAADAAKQPANFKLFAQHLMDKYSSSPYASFAAMLLARDAVNANELSKAEQDLQWVIDHARSKDLRQIARVRAARVLIADQKLDQALALLQKVDDSTYEPLIGEVKGDIYLAKNDKKSALQEYKNAFAAANKIGVTSPVLAIKLSQLAGN
jgi:predicted negative regulator of RcsB-dependent stress response